MKEFNKFESELKEKIEKVRAEIKGITYFYFTEHLQSYFIIERKDKLVKDVEEFESKLSTAEATRLKNSRGTRKCLDLY